MVRETIWGDVVGTRTTVTSSATAILINVTGSLFLDLRPFTVVRTRGMLYIESDQTAAAEFQGANYGACIVSDQAVAIGITAIPTPTSDQGSDAWFTFESIYNSTGAGDTDNIRGHQKDYDSRAMRRVEDGFQVVFVMESHPAGLTSGLVLTHIGRLLIKLH